MMSCPNCRQPFSEGTEFCSACGQRVGTRCPQCSTWMRIDGQSCPHCGESSALGMLRAARKDRLEAEQAHEASTRLPSSPSVQEAPKADEWPDKPSLWTILLDTEFGEMRKNLALKALEDENSFFRATIVSVCSGNSGDSSRIFLFLTMLTFLPCMMLLLGWGKISLKHAAYWFSGLGVVCGLVTYVVVQLLLNWAANSVGVTSQFVWQKLVARRKNELEKEEARERRRK